MISVEENDKTDDELADNSQGEILHRSKHATDGDDPLRREDEKKREREVSEISSRRFFKPSRERPVNDQKYFRQICDCVREN